MDRQNRMIGLVAVLIAVVPVATTMGDPVGTAFTCPGSLMEQGELVSRFATGPRGCGGQKRSRMARIVVSAQRMESAVFGRTTRSASVLIDLRREALSVTMSAGPVKNGVRCVLRSTPDGATPDATALGTSGEGEPALPDRLIVAQILRPARVPRGSTDRASFEDDS